MPAQLSQSSALFIQIGRVSITWWLGAIVGFAMLFAVFSDTRLKDLALNV